MGEPKAAKFAASEKSESNEVLAREAKEGFKEFSTRLRISSEIKENLPPSEEAEKFEKSANDFQEHFLNTINEVVERAEKRGNRQGLRTLQTFSRILRDAPQSAVEVIQDKKRTVFQSWKGGTVKQRFEGISFKINPREESWILGEEVKFLRVDIVLDRKAKVIPGGEKVAPYTPQQIRFNLYGGRDERELSSMRIDVHHREEAAVEMDVEGTSLKKDGIKHRAFPPSCKGRETLARIQNLIAVNLMPRKSEHESSLDYHLGNVLSGLKEWETGEKKETADKILKLIPETSQYKNKLEEEAAARTQTGKELQLEQEKNERELRIAGKLVDTANRLSETLEIQDDLAVWVEQMREEENIPEDISASHILLTYLLDRGSVLTPEEIAPRITEIEEGSLTEIPEILERAIDMKGGQAVEAADYVRDIMTQIKEE